MRFIEKNNAWHSLFYTTETIDYCPVLSKLFEISDPTSEEIERIKNLDTGAPANTNRLYYDLSVFGMLERRLKHAPSNKIIPQYKEKVDSIPWSSIWFNKLYLTIVRLFI